MCGGIFGVQSDGRDGKAEALTLPVEPTESRTLAGVANVSVMIPDRHPRCDDRGRRSL